MGFSKKIETESGTVGIWELSENAEQLAKKFTFAKQEKSDFDKLRIEKRKKEFLAVRLLIEKLLGSKTELIYSKDGTPQLKDKSLQISISHSAELAAVILSKKQAGIDAENIFRNTEKVAKRFLSDSEYKSSAQNNNPELSRIIYWSAKEAIFKCTSVQEIQFNKQIIIHPFKVENSGQISGRLETVTKTEFFNLSYFFYGNNVIVYCVEG